METQETQRTRCQNCGSQLPERPLSICPYCVMPLGLDGQAAAGVDAESPNAGRIAKVAEQDGYEPAQQWTPPESEDYVRGLRMRGTGAVVIGAGAVVFLLGLLISGEGDLWTHPLTILGGLGVGLGIAMTVQGERLRARCIELPLLKRAGVITDRRSTTEVQGWSGKTVYHFTIEFEGGLVGEFQYPGRGHAEDPYVTGLSGVAYTRGSTLLAFKQIRV